MLFITGNVGKYMEAKELFDKAGIRLERKSLHIREGRGSLEEVAMEKALYAFSVFKQPLFVEDSGLFIPYLRGFPGPFSAWAVDKVGIRGILKLMEGAEGDERKAYFKAVVAFTDGKRIMTFSGECHGRISEEERGISKEGLPYDRIFIPEGYGRTFAEDYELKRKLSHRLKAVGKLLEYLKEERLLEY